MILHKGSILLQQIRMIQSIQTIKKQIIRSFYNSQHKQEDVTRYNK